MRRRWAGHRRSTVSIRTRTARFASSSSNRTARFLSAAIFKRPRPTGEWGGPRNHIARLTPGGQTRNFIARLDATAGVEDSFDPNANSFVNSIAVQADGKILVGGDFSEVYGENTIGGQTRDFIARLDATTGLADSFDPSANDD